eukprot:CAMPEP_0176471642 /NCGR_PEP_ID=MMETSP0127-20121128/41252_1 /TAXON_ID=938130 /ORGANISM="Platyophrya macrostoma, Strain WH" /LENGTH=59 /DNA_ID=CAMNT_0017866325 /DNA_START=21 /DNA_END=197 /DNA_ORIENTATION=+
MSETKIEEILTAASENFLQHGFGSSDELKAMSHQKPSGAFLLLFENEQSMHQTLEAFAS